MTAHHRTRGGQPRLSGRLLRCFGAPQASPELVCCMQPRARQPPAYCCGRPADRATRAGLLGQGAAQVAGVAAQSHQQPTKGDVNLAAAPEERVESRVVAAGRGRARAASGARGGVGLARTQPPWASPASTCISCRTWRTRTGQAATTDYSGRRRLRARTQEGGAWRKGGARSNGRAMGRARACHGRPGPLHARGCGGRVFS